MSDQTNLFLRPSLAVVVLSLWVCFDPAKRPSKIVKQFMQDVGFVILTPSQMIDGFNTGSGSNDTASPE